MKLNFLELSLEMGCPLACTFCPQKLLLGRYFGEDKARKRSLSFDDFRTALAQVHSGGGVSFCGMSEPFQNKKCADMIKYAYEKGYKISLNTTLVGMGLEDFEKIKDVKFDSFILHIPDQEGNSKFEITEDYLKLLKLVDETFSSVYYSCHGTVHKEVLDYIDSTKYAGIKISDRAGNLDVSEYVPNYKMKDKRGKLVCYHGSEAKVSGWLPVMLPDGTLILCCQDYGMKHVLGNLVRQTWDEISSGNEYVKFIKGLEDERIDILCRKCGGAQPVTWLPAMRLRRQVEMGGVEYEIVRRFAVAGHVCVFGLGKYWRDHYYQEHWEEGMGVTLFSDNRQELWNKEINRVVCLPPSELQKYKDLLVVLFVKDGDKIAEQLADMGITNCITIDRVMQECMKLPE